MGVGSHYVEPLDRCHIHREACRPPVALISVLKDVGVRHADCLALGVNIGVLSVLEDRTVVSTVESCESLIILETSIPHTHSVDSLVINRSAKVEFGSINFNFTCKNVELPLLQTPRVDVKGKTLLDADINEDSLKKDWSNYQKAIRESNGTWELYSSKDSIKIHAPAHPFNGQYKIAFYKVKPFGQEHYLMRMSNDSTYIVCEKFFSGYADFDMLKNWEK